MSPLIKLSETTSINESEFFRVNKNSFLFRIKVFLGKEGDSCLMYSPSLNLSGYGDTFQEAEKSLFLSVDLFCESLSKVNSKQRDHLLKNLGWAKAELKNKNYSKSYIDEDGVLQNFDDGTVTSKYFETVAA